MVTSLEVRISVELFDDFEGDPQGTAAEIVRNALLSDERIVSAIADRHEELM